MSASTGCPASNPCAAARGGECRTLCAGCRLGRYESARETAQVRSNVRAFRHETFFLWRCAECRSIVSLRKADLAPYYKAYPFANRKLDRWSRRVFANLLRRMRHAALPKDARILDFGCGEGMFVRYLRERGYRYADGYDPYSRFHAGQTPMAQRYDALVAQDVLEHLEDPAAALAQWGALLKPGGVLLVGTPNADALDLNNPEGCVHSLHQPYHVHILSLPALLNLGTAAGLRPLRVWRRSYCDTLWSSVNFIFMLNYLKAADNSLDAGFEPPRPARLLSSPRLLADALLGWFYSVRSEMTVLFRREDRAVGQKLS